MHIRSLLGMLSVERKKKERLLCLVISIGLIFLMQKSELNVEDKRLFAPPLNQIQLIYSLLKEDYEEKKIMPYDYLNKHCELLGEYSLSMLKNLIQYMNPNYQQEEDIYLVDFSMIEEDRLKEYIIKFAETMETKYYYMPENWDWVYSLYKMKSPFFINKQKKGEELIEGMVGTVKYAIDQGYTKTILGMGAVQYFTVEEKMYVKEKYEELIQMGKDISVDQRLEKCRSVYREIDSLLGGHTSFEQGAISWIEESSYEEALELYNRMYEGDVICSSYARRITDYMGIVAGVLPVLLSVFSLSQGNKRREELVSVKGISSSRFVFNEVIGLLAAYGIVFFIIYLINATDYSGFICCRSIETTYLVFIRYYLYWILPTLLISISMPMFLFEIIKKEVVAELISMIIMMFSVFFSSQNIYAFQPIIRFNAFGYSEEFQKIFSEIVVNRVSVTVLSIVFLIGTIGLHNYRRAHICS